MAIIKPPVKNIWADTGDKTEPTAGEVATGWPLSSTPPSRQRFNWILNFCSNAVRYFSRRGLVDYDAAETYSINDRVNGDDGRSYKSIQNSNINHTPSSSPTWWELWGDNIASNYSLVSNGFFIFPKWLANGLIIQWGVANITISGAAASLPIAFPNAHLFAIGTSFGVGTDPTHPIWINSKSLTTVTLDSGNTPNQQVLFFCLGY